MQAQKQQQQKRQKQKGSAGKSKPTENKTSLPWIFEIYRANKKASDPLYNKDKILKITMHC